MSLFFQACISLLRLPDPKAKKKTVLKVKCFKEASFIVHKEPLSAGAEPGRGSRGDSPLTFGPVSVKIIQETSEIFIFADING